MDTKKLNLKLGDEYGLAYDWDDEVKVEDEFVNMIPVTNSSDMYAYREEYSTKTGRIHYWEYYVTPDEDDYAEFLGKPVEELTEEDLDKIAEDNRSFVSFLHDKYEEAAKEHARSNYSEDDVDWDTPEYDDPYDEYDDWESRYGYKEDYYDED